ncbi:conserved Plasmodium protein, unknown function [Plasmodium gallinaceum]|uniref:Uncharacterized protein n=1 Tax=Plasmodium gallinaceum TaxID=5849 RepID=A0A1J1GWF5_PLAGA|nr:conserved Plasmodium protein, unknown function [Plasmodium gallinaceum]CRG95637.1 conserved Plasmodium protein, unknown function [Plasmodium gallinaceum]
MKLLFFIYNFIYLMNTYNYECYLISKKNSTYVNKINIKILGSVYPESFLTHSKNIIYNSLKITRKKKNRKSMQIYLINKSKLKKQNAVLKNKSFKHGHFLKKNRCTNDMSEDKINKFDTKRKVHKKKEETYIQNNDKNVSLTKKKKKKKRSKKENKNQNEWLLNYIKKNKINKEENIPDDLKDEHHDFLKYFKMQDNTLTSELNPEQSKEIIKSDYFKNLMAELNLKEDEILSMLKRNEKDVTYLINKNLSIEEIEKKAKNEDVQNEKLFVTFMDNRSLKVGNFVNFKKIGRKYKDIIREVINYFLTKKKDYIDMMKNIENANEIDNYIILLKENVFFKDFNNEILKEIVKKTIIMGYLNQVFSNDIQNFEWNKNIEKCIMSSINNKYKVKEIIYSNNSININIEGMKNNDIDSDEYDEIENSIRSSIEEYQKINNLKILSYFNIFITIS